MKKDDILFYLSRLIIGKTPTEIGLALGSDYNSASSSVSPALKSLVRDGFVSKSKIDGRVLYKYIDPNYVPPKKKIIPTETPSGGVLITEKSLLISPESTDQIKELINQGWEFSLHYGDHTMFSSKRIDWESDFTRQMEDGLWDNHESGYGSTPDESINNAYNNIKNGKRLKNVEENSFFGKKGDPDGDGFNYRSDCMNVKVSDLTKFDSDINEEPKTVMVISLGQNDFLNWRDKSGLIPEGVSFVHRFSVGNITYRKVSCICDTKSMTVDQIIETDRAKENPEYNRIIESSRYCLKSNFI
jgi:hypothetical protein